MLIGGFSKLLTGMLAPISSLYAKLCYTPVGSYLTDRQESGIDLLI